MIIPLREQAQLTPTTFGELDANLYQMVAAPRVVRLLAPNVEVVIALEDVEPSADRRELREISLAVVGAAELVDAVPQFSMSSSTVGVFRAQFSRSPAPRVVPDRSEARPG